MTDETQEFTDLLSADAAYTKARRGDGGVTASDPPILQHHSQLAGDSVQWATYPNGVYGAIGLTVDKLPGAVYRLGRDDNGRPLFSVLSLVTDDLIRLPDGASQRVLDSFEAFWNSEAQFRKFGQVFKRGLLLWGPPGSGKTVTVTLLVRVLIERGGIVVIASDPEITAKALGVLRKIEPSRRLICILEDLDELTARYGEAELLSLLDGENQIDNVVYLATTNYPERLDARLVNRPSRFDEVIKIGMPSASARRVYLRSRLTMADLGDSDLNTWVDETDGLSIAHLRELIVAVFCLGREYGETLTRLKGMQRLPKSRGDNVIGLVAAKSNG